MCHCGRLLIFASFALCLFGLFLNSASASTVSSEQGELLNSLLLHQIIKFKIKNYFDKKHNKRHKNEIIHSINHFLGNVFDRKRRIAYYYPQRLRNFAAFDDEDESQGKLCVVCYKQFKFSLKIN